MTGKSRWLSASERTGFPEDYQVYYASIILDVENFGMVSFVVAYANLGSPTLQCTVNSIDFLQTLLFHLQSEILPKGYYNGKSPKYLIGWISQSSGSLSKGNLTTILASLRLANISSFQDLSGTLQIQSNSITGSSYAIPVSVSSVAITPSLYCSVDTLNFKLSDNKVFTIKNAANGLLNWEITGTPEWLIISPVSGSLNSGNSTPITVSLNYFNINLDQDLSGTIQIINNSPGTGFFPIPVNVHSSSTILPRRS